MNKKIIFILIFFIILFSSTYILFDSFKANNQKQDVLIKLNNIEKADIYLIDDQGSNKKVVTISDKANNVSLTKYQDFDIRYTATNDYESGIYSFYNDKKTTEIIVNPYYSNDILNNLLNQEKDTINNVVNNYIAIMSAPYTIKNISLFGLGDISGVTLTYIGDDIFNSDTIRLALQKDNNNWTIINNKPELVLTKYNTPAVKADILEKINLLQ
jgi:hypothetical protein